ncbi:unnamed protein product [Lupinus luteus]|uniref:Vacuolar protein sorting-associated protein 51 homolog n=1 Tax=Lupinus luteus TaxID=3873 RepID=A0AAV1WPE2_LUPLU
MKAHKSNLEGLLQKHVQMAAEIKNLDTDLQMLVYENYNKFICATDTIKRMKSNILGMEGNMENLLEKIMSVQSRSDNVNTSLFDKREHIEKLHRTCNLLRKIQFIYDLPDRLVKCIKSEAYADAVRFYTGAMPVFKAYGDSSFQECKRASEEAIAVIIKNLQEKVFSDSESMQVDNLKAKLLEKLEHSLKDVQLIPEEIGNASPSNHEAAICEFVEAIRAFRVIFPDSEEQLVKLARDLVTKHFVITEEYVKTRISGADLLGVLRVIWNDVLLMDKVSGEAALYDHSLEAAKVVIKLYFTSTFSYLLQDISDSLLKVVKRDGVEKYSLGVSLDACTKAILQGGKNFLVDVHKILEDNSRILDKLRELIIDWVQEGFQEFFRQLEDQFLLLSGRNSSSSTQNHGFPEGAQDDKALAGLVLVLAQLSSFIEKIAIPKITEESAISFSGDSVIGYEYGPAFIPREISWKFRSAGEKFLQQLEVIGNEVRQILPQGIQKHRRAASTGSTASSISNSLREEKMGRSNTQKARSQLLETHLAKLFKQKVEIFTKVEYTQGSVVTTIVKLCLKSLQEFVRLQTFNRSGLQQLQLDIQFLRTPLREIVEDEAAMDFLLDEVIVAVAERCLDPIPLEPPILDKLIQAKLAKTREQNAISS